MRAEQKLCYYADFENHFKDLTLDPFVYEFNEEEEIEGHKFVHIRDGIFRAEPVFGVTRQEIKKLSRIYRDVVFYGYYRDDFFEVWFALSETGCLINSNYWYCDARDIEDLSNWKWWEKKGKDEIPRMAGSREQALAEVKFESNGFFFVCDDEEDTKPLPKKKLAFNFKYERVIREDGTVPRIMINGCIGDMVEPGIYHFSKEKTRGIPMVTTMTTFTNSDVAAVANFDYGITMDIFLHYVATDKKYFNRLRELANNMDGCIYHEFKRTNSEEKVEKKFLASEELDEMTKEAQKTAAKEADDKEQTKQELIRQLGGTELIEGLGMTDLELCYEIPLVKKQAFKKYEYAAKNGDMLILVYEDWRGRHGRKKNL